jgi:RHS repeat-associated protein
MRLEAAAASAMPLPVWAASASKTPSDLGIEWDAENRLTRVCTGVCQAGTDPPNMLARFTYDGSSKRATKTADGVTTTYVHGRVNILEERSSAGSTKRYAYGTGIDRPLAQVIGSTPSYNVADHLGSVIRTMDSLGVPTLTRQYDPWGNPIQGSSASGYSFTGREWDAETSLYYYRTRYYDPSTGRFVSPDKASRAISDSNPYSYVDNAPSNFGDPTGMVQVDPAFPQPYRRDVFRAIRILSRAADAIPKCNCQYKEAGGSRTLKELLAASDITIHYDPDQSYNDLGIAYTNQGDIHNIYYYPLGCRMGRWTMASYLAHELMHITLVPGPGQEDAAYTAQLVCGFQLFATETVIVTP